MTVPAVAERMGRHVEYACDLQQFLPTSSDGNSSENGSSIDVITFIAVFARLQTLGGRELVGALVGIALQDRSGT